jgi:phosphatidylserine/phosphatidylglycerophosphate/cardiolipin synthase-like enzyme
METDSKISKGFLYLKLRQVLADASTAARPPIKVIPVAYPVVKMGYQVRERFTWSIGLVERYLLEALQKFGPHSASGLAELLGLDPRLINRTLNRMKESGASIVRESEIYSFKKISKTKDLGKEISLTRSFLLNGVTGRLLPIELLDENEPFRLTPVEGKDCLKDDHGCETAVRAWFNSNHGTFDARDEIESLIHHEKAKLREDLGLPEGLVALGRRDPQGDELAWVPALVTIDEKGNFEVRGFLRNASVVLLPQGEAQLQWLGRSCQGITAKDLVLGYDLESMAGQIEKLNPGAYLKNGVSAGEVLLGTRGSLHWPLNDLLGAEEKAATAWLTRALTAGFWWDLFGFRPTYAFARILPGDEPTARLVCLLRGRREFTRLDEQRLASGFDLHTWWMEFQKELASGSPVQVPPLLPLGELRQAIEITPDTALHEKFQKLEKGSRLKAWAPLAAKGAALFPKTTPALLLNRAPDDCLGSAFARLADASNSEIKVFSPVIDDPGVVEALIRARGRKVSIKVITELVNRRNESLSFPTRGFGFGENELDLPAHLAATRRLGQHSIRCRSPRFYPHAKLWIFDRARVVVTSANLNSNSLGTGKNNAVEAGVVFEAPEMVDGLSAIFERLWDSCPYQQHRSDSNISLSEEFAEASSVEEPLQPGNTLLQACWNLPPSHGALLKTLVSDIDSAKSTLLISSLSLYATKKVAALHSALMKALERGVKVTVVVRHDAFPETKYPDLSTMELLAHGLRLVTRSNLHFKAILVDGRHVGIFSANLNPYSLNPHVEGAHIELGVFGPAERELAGAAEFLEQLGESPEYEYSAKS